MANHDFEFEGQKFNRYDVEILKAVEDLHVYMTGSSDMDSREVKILVHGLKWRLKNWVEPSSCYDLLVKCLLSYVLDAFEKSGVAPQGK
jgi:hypothetical protein